MEQRLVRAEAMQVRVTGRDEGKNASTAMLFAVVGLLIAVAGIIVAAFHH
jgi:hypothetical protein